jgi:hypothetical protein
MPDPIFPNFAELQLFSPGSANSGSMRPNFPFARAGVQASWEETTLENLEISRGFSHLTRKTGYD